MESKFYGGEDNPISGDDGWFNEAAKGRYAQTLAMLANPTPGASGGTQTTPPATESDTPADATTEDEALEEAVPLILGDGGAGGLLAKFRIIDWSFFGACGGEAIIDWGFLGACGNNGFPVDDFYWLPDRYQPPAEIDGCLAMSLHGVNDNCRSASVNPSWS